MSASVGVFDHWGWAILVTVARDGRVLDRRRIALIEDGVPAMPYHHDAQRLPIAEAEALVQRVTRSATKCAGAGLKALAQSVKVKIEGIALRENPPLPPTLAERLADYQAQNVADSVLYREALARAAEARGWSVGWYDAKRLTLDDTGRPPGPPWTRDHRIARAAARTMS